MKKIFLGLLAIMVSVTLFAAPRTMEEAAQIAAQFTNQQPQLRRLHKAPRAAANMRLAHKALQNDSENAAFYVFNQEGNNGFVIVSADDRTSEDVLGYTENGAFDANNINPNLQWWLNRYAEEITVLQTLDDSQLEPRKAVQVTAIPNLLVDANGTEITWYQETPYNDLCPIDQYDNTRCLTGCVATAAAQVMFKYRHPVQGTGSSSYTWFDCTSGFDDYYNCIGDGVDVPLSANYGATTYDWNNMLPAYEGVSSTAAQKNAVATLMYQLGVASEMIYGGEEAGGSGTMTDYMAYALQTYFDYEFDKFITMYSRSKYSLHQGVTAEFSVTKAQITNYFNADLEAGRPIIMGGDGSEGGHEFVCCGRDTQNKFYINFGWEGSGNGYYTLFALGPSEAQFSNNLDAIIGLRPKTAPVDPFNITWMSNGAQFTTTNSTGKVVLPTTDPAACDGKVFVGWCDQADYASATTAPTFVKAGDAVEEGAIFYAVFAEQSGEGGAPETTTYTFTSKSWADATNSWISDGDGNQLTSNQGVQVTATIGTAGAHTTKSFSNVSKAVVSYCTNASKGAGSIEVTIGGQAVSKSVTKTGGVELRDLEFDFTNASGTATIEVTCTTNSIYVNAISITSGTGASYSNYSTSCGGATAIENTKAEVKAVKVLENGQIVIIRDNEKYTIFGHKIQ